jgi:hypothetical protein
VASQRRREAIAAGVPVENAEAVRRRRRKEAAIAREETAIALYAKGKTTAEISDALFDEYGVRLRGNILELVRRGLARRVEQGAEDVEQAREMLAEGYRRLLAVYMPRALGEMPADDDGNTPPPDLRAAEFVLKTLREWGVIRGAVAPPRAGDLNLNIGIGVPLDADSQRAKILHALEVDAAKQREIEGTLAHTPAVGLGHEDALDGKIMPPVPLAPQERE